MWILSPGNYLRCLFTTDLWSEEAYLVIQIVLDQETISVMCEINHHSNAMKGTLWTNLGIE
jgi:hypothetical protein